MLNGANSDEFLDTVLLSELGGSLDEAILIRCTGKVIMSEVDYVLSTLESNVEICCSLSLELLQLNIRRERSLPGIDRLSIRPVVEESDLGVATFADEAGYDSTSNRVGAIDNNQFHLLIRE